MEPLELLTFNIRGKDVSQWAKKGFTRKEKFARIAAMVGSHRPNVVTLQEVPADKAGLMAGLMEEEGYTELCSAPSTSSSGGTFIYYEDNLVDAAGLPEVGPVALARIRRLRLASDSTVDVFLAACHLSHGRGEGASERRRDQLAAALAALPEGCLVVVAGDMNLRGEREDRLVERLGLEDAFVQKGRPEEKYTWDPFNNRYHGDSQKFKRERYDRVLLRGGLRATSLKLIGNVPVTPAQPNGQGQVDCLSDHFGLLCKIGLRGSSHTSLRI